MTWQAELRAWLANGPRPHEPPGDSRSVYGWLKDRGEQILADAGELEQPEAPQFPEVIDLM